MKIPTARLPNCRSRAKTLVELANHFHREGALALENVPDLGAAAEKHLQIAFRPTPALKMIIDHFDRK